MQIGPACQQALQIQYVGFDDLIGDVATLLFHRSVPAIAGRTEPIACLCQSRRLSVRSTTTPLSARLVAIMGLLVCGIFAGMIAVSLWQARQDAWKQASRVADNLVLLVNRDIQRHFDVFTVTLKGLRHYVDVENVLRDPHRLQRVLAIAAEGAVNASSIYMLDASGRVIAESDSLEPRGVDLSDRDYFQVQRDRTDAGIFLSAPYRSRLADGAPSLILSMRVTDRDGRFAGVLALAFRLSYMAELFQSLEANPGDIISLVNTTGRMLVRVPSWKADGDMGTDISGSENFRRMMVGTSGDFIGRSLIDGVPRYYHYEHIPSFPLVVTVGLGVQDIFADWRRRAWLAGSATFALCVLVIVASFLLRREIIARARADAELRRLSETDGLTGIANRRSFDDHLTTEWKRARRTAEPLSLLMIDADRFKTLNDRFGHARGDEVLKVIARLCAANARRPTDLAARYGGEEFAVILPDTTLEAARDIAEAIRRDVAVEASKAEAMTTVSIGVASSNMVADTDPVALIRVADAALYIAKTNGRNRVEAPAASR